RRACSAACSRRANGRGSRRRSTSPGRRNWPDSRPPRWCGSTDRSWRCDAGPYGSLGRWPGLAPWRRPRMFFLAVQSVKGDDAVRDVEFANQPLRGGDLVGLFLDIDVGQDHARFGIECVQQLGRLAVAEIVETAPQRLAVERDGAPGR